MNKKDEVISFRISQEKYKEYELLIKKSGMGKSAFFRQIVLDNKCTFVIKEKKIKTRDYIKLIYITNKASNNINQIAKVINTHAKAGILDSSKLPLIFNMLAEISNFLRKNIDE